MLAANQAITVINRIYDSETDTETEVSATLDGVSVYGDIAASAVKDGLTNSGLLKIRIPYTLPAGVQLTAGSTIIWNGRSGTILRARDNIARAFSPHWYVEVE